MGQVFWNAAEELATVSTTFSVDGTATDPTTVTLVVTDPDGGSNTYTYADTEITKDGTGQYHKDVSCASTTPGVWTAVWVGTTDASDVDVVTWTTYDTDLSKLHITPDELKKRKGIDDNLNDVEILGVCLAATSGVNLHCGRVFSRAAGTRVFDADSDDDITGKDIVSVTTLKTDEDGDGVYETTWSSADFQLLDVDAQYKPGGPWPYTSIHPLNGRRFPTGERKGLIQIEGVFEWPRTPTNVRQAAAVIAGDLLKVSTAPFGVAGYAEYGAVRARDNPIAAVLLGPYRRSPLDL